MTLVAQLIAHYQQEANTTRKLLERLPEDKLSWKPHEKSMTLGRLAMHISELPKWVVAIVRMSEFNFATWVNKPIVGEANKQILEEFETNLAKAIHVLEGATDEQLQSNWKVLRGETLVSEMPRENYLRRELSHIIHHRGQLSVYLRLLDVPLPNMYGPTADER